MAVGGIKVEAGFVSIGDVTFRDLEDEAIVELVRKVILTL